MLNVEYIDMLREDSTIVQGDVDHTTITTMEELRGDILVALPDTIITTVKLSVVIADLLDESCHLVGTREVSGIECIQFITLAPFALRIAILGTDFCVDGEYIMFREYDFVVEREDDSERPEPVVLVRQGIQG